VAIALFTAVATGCASKKPNAALDSARSTYEKVSETTLQDEYSTEDLNVAKRKIDSANRAWKDKKDKKTINHRAYLAEQYALIAEQRSELLKYQAKIENGNIERTKIQVNLRAAEAEAAQLQAVKLQKEVTDRQAEAEAAQQQAVKLQKEVTDREAELARQLAELEEFKALQAKNTERGMVLTLGDVLFDTGESSLKADAKYNIERVANFLQKYPDRSLTIEGHTDNVGDEDFNYNLSVERAFSVRSALVDQGIDQSRIQAEGFGEVQPIASNSNSTGRQRNRRVDLIFNHKEENKFTDTVISVIEE